MQAIDRVNRIVSEGISTNTGQHVLTTSALQGQTAKEVRVFEVSFALLDTPEP